MMLMYSLIEYSDNYAETGGISQYHKVDANEVKNNGRTPAVDNTKDVETAAPLKYLSNFWRILEMPLINYEINLLLTWSANSLVTDATGTGTFAITDAKWYILVVTLSTQGNRKLLQ